MRPNTRLNTFNRLCAVLLMAALIQDPALLLAEGGFAKHKKARAESQLTEAQRATHALNRLTFGPQPGEVERVQAIGLEKWIDLQLNPERIDDSLLEAELQKYPLMHMPLPAMMEQFPNAAFIRAVADGKAPMPSDRVQRAIYQNQIDDYEIRKQKQAQEAATTQSGVPQNAPQTATTNQVSMQASPDTHNTNQPGVAQAAKSKEDPLADAMALEDIASSPSMLVHEQKLYADLATTAIVNLPPDQRWNRLVDLKPAEFRAFLKGLSPEERVHLTSGMSPQQKETVYALINPTLVVSGELLQTRLLTDIYTQRQLQAVMTDFWLNHFNVYLRKGPFAPWFLIDYERNAIAPHAMGKFEDLLVATAKSPAMLFYLDNHTSIGPNSVAATRALLNPNNQNKSPGLNENYARELMELHTLGVDGGYTQKDVTEVAKVFTGWTIEDPRKGGEYIFNERRHEPGPKYVLGHTIQQNGEQEGLEVLHILATSPATAHHLSQQLAVRFVSDNPPPALVNRMAKTYLKSDGDIRQVLRTMFDSPEFWSKDVYRAKVKTPEEFVISAVRATNGEVLRPVLLLNAMNELGMPFYGCQTPNGYPWTAETWVNTGDLLNRMNISLALAGHKLGTATDMDALMRINSADAEPVTEKESKLEQAFLDGQLTPQMRDALLHQLDQGVDLAFPQNQAQPRQELGQAPGQPRRAAMVQMLDMPMPIAGPADKQAALLAGLLLGSPEFQKK
jgi:uncharacterized protein (DUF1800 family)